MSSQNEPAPPTLRIRTTGHLANQLNVDKALLVHVAQNAHQYYKEFEKDVKGKRRKLVMAKKELATLQRRILTRVLCRLPASPYAYGAVKGRSIKDNATVHSKSPFIIKLDIRDFYPSIRFKKVYDFFMTQDCSPDVARLLTLLVTRNYSLPLGVSTSPMLADQIIRKIDARISGMAQKAGLLYTRYVDDITISGDFPVKKFVSLVVKIIREAGFQVKKTKLELYEPGDGKERIITGVSVNNGAVFAPQEYVQSLKKELTEALEQSRHQHVHDTFESKQQYFGKIGFVRWIDPKAGRELLQLYRKIQWKHLEWALMQAQPAFMPRGQTGLCNPT